MSRNDGEANAPVHLLALLRPESFGASLRARWVQAGEFRLHYRGASEQDALIESTAQAACAVGFVLPKRQCKHAARRNLIRRIARERFRAHLGEHPRQPGQPLPVLVLRLQAKLDPRWRSAQSKALREYLHQTIGRLLAEWESKRQRVAAPEGIAGQAAPTTSVASVASAVPVVRSEGAKS
jgi:ribonuclease P protein component